MAQRRGLSVAGILHALENTLVDGEDEDDGLEFPQVDTWKKIMGLRWTVFNTSCHFPTSKASFEYLHQCFGSVFFPGFGSESGSGFCQKFGSNPEKSGSGYVKKTP